MNLNLYYRKIYKKFKERKYEGNLDGDTEGQTLCAEYGTPFPSYTYLAPPIEFLKAKDETQKHLLRSSCSFDPVSHFVEQYPDLKPETIKRYKLIILEFQEFSDNFLPDDVNKYLEIKFGPNYTPITFKSFSFSTYQMYKKQTTEIYFLTLLSFSIILLSI